MFRTQLVMLMIAIGPVLASPQDPATNDEQTLQNYLDALETNLGKQVQGKIETSTNQAMTSAASFATDLQGSLKNFLPLFEGFVQAVQPSKDGKQLSINFTPLNIKNGKTFLKNSEILVQAVVYEPEILKPFTTSIENERVRELISEKVSADFDNSSDISLELSWNLEAGGFGRRFSAAQAKDISTLFRELKNVVGNSADDLYVAFVNDLKGKYQKTDDILTLKLEEVKKIPGMWDRIQTFVKQWKEEHQKLQDHAKSYQFMKLAQLVNNQNQLHITGSYRKRDSFVGSNQWSVNATYEVGLVNWRTWKKYVAREQEGEKSGLAVWKAFMKEGDIMKNLDAANRFALTLEYARSSSLDLTSPLVEGLEAPIMFHQDPANQFKATITWGRYFYVNEDGDAKTRLDLSGSYEDYSDDETRNDRGVLTLTYSYKVSDQISIPLVLNYANHGKYLPDSDSTFNSHIGFSYKLNRKAKE